MPLLLPMLEILGSLEGPHSSSDWDSAAYCGLLGREQKSPRNLGDFWSRLLDQKNLEDFRIYEIYSEYE